jgi:hypothetical protein
MREKITAIYVIENLVNSHKYLGKVEKRPVEDRWAEHKRNLKLGKHVNSRLQNAWNKYRKENFGFKIQEILQFDSSKEFILEKEAYWIQIYGGINSKTCYNLVDATISPAMSEEICQQRRGEGNPSHKLELYQINEIRTKWLTGEYTTYQLAREYNISPRAIQAIVNNKTWYDSKYIPPDKEMVWKWK